MARDVSEEDVEDPGWQPDPAAQIRWGLAYIARTYSDQPTGLGYDRGGRILG